MRGAGQAFILGKSQIWARSLSAQVKLNLKQIPASREEKVFTKKTGRHTLLTGGGEGGGGGVPRRLDLPREDPESSTG
jgi:hypothetical protein